MEDLPLLAAIIDCKVRLSKRMLFIFLKTGPCIANGALRVKTSLTTIASPKRVQ